MHVVSEGELTEKAGASKTEDNYGWRSQSGDESFDVGAIQGRTIDTALVQGCPVHMRRCAYQIPVADPRIFTKV